MKDLRKSTPVLLASLLASMAALASPQTGGHAQSIDKVNGSITAQAGQTYGGLSTVNGGIKLERGIHAKAVETVNGSIEATDDVSSDAVSTDNGSIRFGRQARIEGSVETVNGSIFIDRNSQVRGDISTVNGGIGIIGTALDGGIDTVNGDITVGADSRVKGGIKVEKPHGSFGSWFGKPKIPHIVIGPNAVVEGPLVFEREVKLYLHTSAKTGAISGAIAVRYDGTPPNKD